MSRRLLCALLLVAACAHAPPAAPAPMPAKAPAPPPAVSQPATLPGEQVLSRQPQVLPLAPFNAPVPTVAILRNGLKLYVVERPGDAIEAIDLVVKRGATSDPERLAGLASMSAAMLETGAGGMSQFQLAQAADRIGASIGASAGDDDTVVSVSAMPEQLAPMVSLLSTLALRPTLAPAEWKKLKAHRIAELLAARADPVAADGLAWRRAAYGDHPLGDPLVGTPESIQRMQLSDVRRFVRGYAPGDSALIAVGGASATQVKAALEKAFGHWKGRSTPDVALEQRVRAMPRQGPRFIAVDFPGKPQTVVRVGEPAVSRASPDYLALNLLNAILGGSFTSRLNQNLRERHGYTYGAFSGFAFGIGPGPFVVETSVKTDVTAAALGEILSELQRAAQQPISEADLKKGKSLLAFDLVQALEHTDGAAAAIGSIFVYDLPLDEYQTFVSRLNALTVQDVRAAGARVLHPERMTIAVAGDLKVILPEIAKSPTLELPAPQRWGPGGEPLKGTR